MTARGYFEIGIVNGKTSANLGTLWRSAYQMGAAGIFTIGGRYRNQASDTTQAWRHVPMREHASFAAFLDAAPRACPIVAIEMGGRPLADFTHPERAIYLLGAEDGGIPAAVLSRCQHVVALPACRSASYNVAIAGALVMFDRQTKRGAWPQHAAA